MTVDNETTPAVSSLKRSASFGKLHIISFIAIAIVALLAINHLMAEVNLSSVRHALRNFNTHSLLFAGLAAAASYIAMMGYDLCGVRYAGVKVPVLHTLRTSFCAFGLGNTLGGGWLSSGAVRFRLYSSAGVDPLNIGKIIAFITWGFGLGIVAISVFGLLARPEVIADLFEFSIWVPRLIGIIGALFVLVVLVLPWMRDKLHIGRWALRLPSGPLTLAQVLLAVLDLVTAALTLWFLLPSHDMTLPTFMGVYAIAIAAGLISHVPGGLGVFESVIIFALKPYVDIPELTAALVVYRIVYYLVPFMLALLMFTLHEASIISRWYRGSFLSRGAGSYGHLVLAGATFFTGAMLMASGALPAARHSLRVLDQTVPLVFQEVSHFLASLGGLAMLALSQGLRLRSHTAWQLSCAIVAINIPLALLKGLAVTETLILVTILTLLFLARPAFYRRTRLNQLSLTPDWWFAFAATLVTVTWLLFFAYKHVEYSSNLWWQFESMAEAPRSLRAIVGVAAAAFVLGFMHLLRPHAARPKAPDAAARAQASAIVRKQTVSEACLANLGDKYFLFSDSGQSFIMYGVRGRSWISLLDPIGPVEEHAELVWRFREMCDRAGSRAAAYQVSVGALSYYIDAGFSARRLGEEARVNLADFDIGSSSFRSLRQSWNRAQRDGLTFEIIPKAEVPTHLSQLEAISDAWLDGHETREKSFSLGNFSTAYVTSQPVAIIRLNGKAVAFATLMLTDQKVEASIDLMRHLPEAPGSVMDFLFVSLIQHFKAEGYVWFCLGMAPLAGLAVHPLASFWHKAGRQLFLRGERLYNFQGLRSYKEKFHPVWRPRYLMTTSSLSAYVAMLDTAALISGDLRGMVTK
ncbi:bifunctional lysylphosphatidylglycerol flippase/synthetase MprF [Govanella unica]|uniref:Phosphatidylglycerol lysyltransferase n=1 Tax=Govanella unica TaxID=2975056 RepID=A0A9X3TYZ7_9PROT|nr:bifunctional lysylphosphatidylglycerol flippase/synthetase MprF [Govania unica]MDA5194571.1 bifunctional lysylphosphatidylglycerol flippase/synthetase MprF [Govania unica]